MYTAKSMCSGARPKDGVAGTGLGVRWGVFGLLCVCGWVSVWEEDSGGERRGIPEGSQEEMGGGVQI